MVTDKDPLTATFHVMLETAWFNESGRVQSLQKVQLGQALRLVSFSGSPQND